MERASQVARAKYLSQASWLRLSLASCRDGQSPENVTKAIQMCFTVGAGSNLGGFCLEDRSMLFKVLRC